MDKEGGEGEGGGDVERENAGMVVESGPRSAMYNEGPLGVTQTLGPTSDDGLAVTAQSSVYISTSAVFVEAVEA